MTGWWVATAGDTRDALALALVDSRVWRCESNGTVVIAVGWVFSGGVDGIEAWVDAWGKDRVNGSMKAWTGRVIVVAVVANGWVHGYMSVVMTMVV